MARTKGAKGKTTMKARELADSLGVDPLEILLHFASGNWQALGYDSPEVKRVSAQGNEYYEDVITADLRLSAAKDAVKYIYPAQKAIEFTNEDGSVGIKVVIEDFTAG